MSRKIFNRNLLVDALERLRERLARRSYACASDRVGGGKLGARRPRKNVVEKRRTSVFVKWTPKSLDKVKILNGVANGLIAMFVDYCCDVELFGEETRRLCCLVVGRRVESEVSSPSFQPRTVLSPRRARTSSRRLFYESFAPTLSR